MMLHGLLYLLSLIAVEGESLQVWNNGLPTSLRGIHVFTNEEVWVSGSAGYIGHTVNGGSDWAFRQIPGWESAEFRDIEKINDSTVLVMSSTLPAAILISEDNGLTFRTVYSSPDSTYFLDGMDCNSNGDCILYGDPIEGYICYCSHRRNPAISGNKSALSNYLKVLLHLLPVARVFNGWMTQPMHGRQVSEVL